MRINIYYKEGKKDFLLLKHQNEDVYSFINLTDSYISDEKYASKEKALECLEIKKINNEIKNYKVVDDNSFLDDGIFIGNYFVPNQNPKKINCTTDELIYDNNKIIGLKELKFTCDNCSTPMVVMYGPHGHFIGCPNWKTSNGCKKNTIKLNIVK